MTQETNDVVKQLRAKATWKEFCPADRDDFAEAADALQSQSARIAELEGLLREVRRHIRTMDGFIEAKIDATLSLTKDSTSG